MWEAIKSLPTWAQIVFVIFVIALAGSIGLVRHQARLSIRQQKELDRQQKTLDDKQRELDRLKMKHQEQHIYFLDQWRIKPAQLHFEKKLAAGAEGEVWRGRLLGHDRKGLVAIKKALPNPMSAGEAAPVWTEREVSFLMSMNHPQIVEFIGAGEIMDEKFGEHVPFIVQELMSGGSIGRVPVESRVLAQEFHHLGDPVHLAELEGCRRGHDAHPQPRLCSSRSQVGQCSVRSLLNARKRSLVSISSSCEWIYIFYYAYVCY